MDVRDYITMTIFTLAFVAATVYLFVYHSIEVFAAWCGLVGTMGGIYHYLCIRDDKIKDAE